MTRSLESGVCFSCKERPVFVKKWQLCKPCYAHRLYVARKGNAFQNPTDYASPPKAPSEPREIAFIRNYFSHTRYIYQPATFRLGQFTYTPDFFDQVRSVFIEVAGTRQAYEQNKHKYPLFRKLFPAIQLEIRKPDGYPVSENGGPQNWEQDLYPTGYSNPFKREKAI